jgi:hypothetical protein
MFKFILLLAWPFIRRYLANRSAEYAADFLNRRRAERFRQGEEELPEAPADQVECTPVTLVGYSPGDVFWFTLSGLLLGSALGVLVSYLTRQDE